MPIPVRVSGLVSLILLFSLSLTAALGYAKFQKALAEVIQARHQVTLHSLADGIETGINLGLPPGEVQNLRPQVERAAHDHADLLLVEVLDPAGKRIFFYQQSETPLERSWTGQKVAATGWKRFGPQTIGMAEPLENTFGQRVGIIVLEFARTGFDASLAEISKFTLDLLLAVCGCGAVLCAVLGLMLHRPLDRLLERMERELETSVAEAGALPLRVAAARLETTIPAAAP